jgi:hypothetical protein
LSPCFDRKSCSRYLHRNAALTLLLLLAANAIAAPKVETVGPCTDSTVPSSVKKALAPTGYRVTLDDGSPLDFWPPAQVQTSDKPREDATYPLAPSLFFGVIISRETRAMPAATQFLPVRTPYGTDYSPTMAIIWALRLLLTSCFWCRSRQIQIRVRPTASISSSFSVSK